MIDFSSGLGTSTSENHRNHLSFNGGFPDEPGSVGSPWFSSSTCCERHLVGISGTGTFKRGSVSPMPLIPPWLGQAPNTKPWLDNGSSTMADRKTRVPKQMTEANMGTFQQYKYLKIMTYCITTYCLVVHFDRKT